MSEPAAPPGTGGPFARRDPSFDIPQFLARAESVVPLVLRARSEQRPDLARTVVDDDMLARLRAETVHGRDTVLQGVRVRGAELVHASTDDVTDTVAVRFRFEGICYQASADGRPVRGQSADPRHWVEDWWFRRPAGSKTAAGAVELDHCQGCGSVLEPDAAGRCVACGRAVSGDPSGWMLSRVADAADEPVVPTVVVHRTRGRLVGLVLTLLVVGMIGAAVVAVTRTVSDSVSEVTDAVTSGSTGGSIPGLGDLGEVTGGGSPPTSYVTPVGNAAIQAPVNDVGRAIADIQATAGRPATAVSAIHLYQDGRIVVEMQAPDDLRRVDNYTWQAGEVTSAQGRSSVQADTFFDATAVDVSNLEALCNTALGATGVPDGIVDHPYLLGIVGQLRWYIPVQSASRPGSTKTYRVAPDGSGAEVF